MLSDFDIYCLVPDLPAPEMVYPYLQEIHENRWYTNFGPLVRRFEQEITDFLRESGSDASVQAGTFSNATVALEMAIRTLRLPEASHILVPSLTFPATALAVINAGHTPVFSDVCMDSWSLTPEIASECCRHNTIEAVIPVAAFGQPVDAQKWQAFQANERIPVILDAAAALGQQKVVEGVTTVFSLHATKPFGVGEGGLLASDDAEFIQRAQSLSNFGFQGPEGKVQHIGSNAKMSEYHAAVGLAQIQRWQEVCGRREKVIALYRQELSRLEAAVSLQKESASFIPAVFPILSKGKRQKIMQALAATRIQTRHWYLPLLHEHPALEGAPVCGALHNATILKDGLVGLPFHAFLTEGDIHRIVSEVENICHE